MDAHGGRDVCGVVRGCWTWPPSLRSSRAVASPGSVRVAGLEPLPSVVVVRRRPPRRPLPSTWPEAVSGRAACQRPTRHDEAIASRSHRVAGQAVARPTRFLSKFAPAGSDRAPQPPRVRRAAWCDLIDRTNPFTAARACFSVGTREYYRFLSERRAACSHGRRRARRGPFCSAGTLFLAPCDRSKGLQVVAAAAVCAPSAHLNRQHESAARAAPRAHALDLPLGSDCPLGRLDPPGSCMPSTAPFPLRIL